jgi:hypothetical protein
MAVSEFAVGIVVGAVLTLLFVWMALESYYGRLP